jgi:transcriptional regulator with XRE-family HTH domain
MNKPLDASRVKAIRRQRRLSQDGLATRAKLSKETIYRIEKGEQSGTRHRTIDRLARALDVAPGVLTGELPAPASDGAGPDAPDAQLFEMYPMNYRVDGSVRNAFTLAALRYQVPIARIVELAPLLFVLAAEASLKRRTEKLDELEALFERENALRREFRHLPPRIIPNYLADEAFDAERTSIAQRDLLAIRFPEDLDFPPTSVNHDVAENNPFVLSLKSETERYNGVAVMERFDRHDVTFHVCPEEALELACGDTELADYILRGCIVLYMIPRELLAADAADARVTWLRAQKQDYDAALKVSLDELFPELPDAPDDDARTEGGKSL